MRSRARRPQPSFVFLLVCAVPSAALAESSSDNATSTVEIHARSDAYDVRRDDTAGAIIVPHDELVKFGDTELVDAIKRLPGVTVNANGIAMRGLGNGYTQILLNGEKAPPGFTFDSLSPDMIERIEIRRAATADLGTQAVAGTINIVLRKAPAPGSAGKPPQREFKAGFLHGSGHDMPSASVQLSGTDRDRAWTFDVSGSSRHADLTDFDAERGTDGQGNVNLVRDSFIRIVSRNDVLNVAPRLTLSGGNGDKLDIQPFLNAEHFVRRQDAQTMATVGALPTYPDDLQQYRSNTVNARLDLTWSRRFADESRLEAKGGLNVSGRNNEFHEHAWLPDGTLNLDDTTMSMVRDSGVSTTGKYSTAAIDNHAITVGWDAGWSRRRENRIQHNRELPGIPAYDYALDFDAVLWRLAAYAQDEWTITPKLSVYAGVRSETVDSRVQTRSDGSDLPVVHNRTGVLSPLLHGLWKFSTDRSGKTDQLRLALTRTFKAPTLFNLIPRPYTTANNSAINPDFQGNPNLHPELAWGLDTAYEHYGSAGETLGINAYARRIRDVVHVETFASGNRWVAMPVNAGAAQAHGIEFDGKAPLRAWWPTGPEIDLRANAARNWSSVDSVPGPDNRLDEQTRFNATLGADWRVRADFSTGVSYAFKTGGTVRIAANQSKYTNARHDLEWYALWKPGRTLQIRLTLSNLLRDYAANGQSYFDGNGRIDEVDTRPSGTSARLNLEMHF